MLIGPSSKAQKISLVQLRIDICDTTHESQNEKEVGYILLDNRLSLLFLISLSSHDWSCSPSLLFNENLFMPRSTTNHYNCLEQIHVTGWEYMQKS